MSSLDVSWRLAPSKVFCPDRIERMGIHSNFNMATDWGIGSQNQLRPFPVGRSEYPFAGFDLLEITILAPAGSSYRMTAPYPGPQRSEDLVIHPSEDFLCNDVPVIIGPSPDDRIERLDQGYLGCRFGSLQNVPDFIQKALNVLSSGPDQEFSAKFPDIFCPRKSKPSPTCVIRVFSFESSRPRSRRNSTITGRTSFSKTSFERPVTTSRVGATHYCATPP